eukprot:TRINITY_DN3409_c0_g1_i5.p1 TRINITY_DN3409_c0_g1~~TRINITY_DN3409_c0_g1_i5.p1  ORF type:complete len:495 (-),score=163.69 TRINITY_DN3409_c0_g1_i5:253-1737(-)
MSNEVEIGKNKEENVMDILDDDDGYVPTVYYDYDDEPEEEQEQDQDTDNDNTDTDPQSLESNNNNNTSNNNNTTEGNSSSISEQKLKSISSESNKDNKGSSKADQNEDDEDDDNDGLLPQDIEKLNPEELHPLTMEVMSRQATINIGTIGHVAHGKSTVVKAISGVQTVRFKNEMERNITIKLGYANAKIFKCTNESCQSPECYSSAGSKTPDSPMCKVPGCGGTLKLMRHVSFVDCPGHDILMATMLNGAAVMDAALLLVAGNESCPQPQTSEHLAAIEIMKLRDIIILQNKVDLVKEAAAHEQHAQILKFVKGTVADGAPIIPISAIKRYNIDVICEMITKCVPIPTRDYMSPARLIVIRSFDVNRPGSEVDDLQGGVAGGSILQGVLKLDDEIEVRPGIVSKDSKGRVQCAPIRSKVMSLFAEKNHLNYAAPGGLIGVGTKIDPTLCRADRLVGQVLGAVGSLPDIYTELEISFFLLRRLLGKKRRKKRER